ncbi:sensor histidine kinase [Hymenobacter baengnokdamensis]|uniref:sensor histidine kinase n=1 Tax=Hymenobacter baengnokdamensis TaxID=2615203 RepID=UPI0012475C73|nr:sensor histidine kinase [Hymenobacter baengnokdamensis]
MHDTATFERDSPTASQYFYHIAWYWHILTWLAVAGYLVLGDYLFNRSGYQGLWFRASFLLASISEFYLCYLLLYPHLLRSERLRWLLPGLLGAVLVFTGLRYGLDETLYPALLGFRNYTSDTTLVYYLRDNLYYSIPMLVLSAAVWAGQVVLRREYENKLLNTERRVAELAFLKTQINPHFLYNTLNMLYGLAYEDNGPLASGLLQLAELMRYMLRDTPDGLVALSQEIDYLEHYLALYRLRYTQQFCADMFVEGDSGGHRVAPLLLVPFVENALKHGVLDDPATPVRLRLRMQPGEVEFTVENHCHDCQTDTTSGIGLANLRRRLMLLYKNRHTLRVGFTGRVHVAYLRLLYETPPAFPGQP